MRWLRASCIGGFAPKPPEFTAFFSPEWILSGLIQGTGCTCPPPFRPLNRSLGLLPSIALSRPIQVGLESTSPARQRNEKAADGDNPLNLVSHSRGSLQVYGVAPWAETAVKTLIPVQ